MPALSWQLLPTASRIITGPRPRESVIFDVAASHRLVEMPGRGLEPLRIAPPDPKSGASANFATLANCDGHEGRFVGRFGQIALASLIRLLRQIERCLRKSLVDLFSSRSLSVPRDKAG